MGTQIQNALQAIALASGLRRGPGLEPRRASEDCVLAPACRRGQKQSGATRAGMPETGFRANRRRPVG